MTTFPMAPPAAPAAPPAPGTPARAARLDGIDLVRGLVVALMVLDHVREYWSDTALAFDPTDLSRTTAAIFLTRWITHLCAPTFVFLAGTSVRLQWARTGDDPVARAAVRRFNVTRGLWLCALELTVVMLGFNFGAPFLFFQVIFAIGLGLVLLAPLLAAPTGALVAVGALALVAGNLLVGPVAALSGALPPALAIPLRVLFVPGPLPGVAGLAIYPVVAWWGIMVLGYAAGTLFLRAPAERRRLLLGLGGALLAAFVVLRLANVGDGDRWAAQASAGFTLLSFIDVSKYPPSPLYALVTLGITIPLCALLEGTRERVVSPVLRAFGRTPMFTYVAHVYLVHGSAMLAGVLMGFPAAAFTNFFTNIPRLVELRWGVGLGWIWLIWLVTCALLWPLARWYDARRTTRPSPWMRYV